MGGTTGTTPAATPWRNDPASALINILPNSVSHNGAANALSRAPKVVELRRAVEDAVKALLDNAEKAVNERLTFKAFEADLVARLFAVGRLIAFHPLDAALGLNQDRMTIRVLSLATRLATKPSFAQAKAVLGWFLSSAPSMEVIEQAVLGLGRRTTEWFEQKPAPKGDGEVLVTVIDSKGAPTATDTELARRRQKRRPKKAKVSQRQRGRDKRARHGSKPRRKKGDKSKNARLATMVVQYTLQQIDGKLHGPINKRVYASFAPKRHAFEFARREADKRGFTKESGKLHQLLTDGDEVLAAYAKDYLPEALHTIDVMHVIEYLWKAGECLYKEGSEALNLWMSDAKDLLYAGRADIIVADLRTEWSRIPAKGPGNKGRRGRLARVIEYIEKRTDKMNYAWLRKRDLEISTGVGEGAVRNVIALRFDHGGMRWIRERAEALLQLRCIEVNGDWDEFVTWVHDEMRTRAIHGHRILRLQQSDPQASTKRSRPPTRPREAA